MNRYAFIYVVLGSISIIASCLVGDNAMTLKGVLLGGIMWVIAFMLAKNT